MNVFQFCWWQASSDKPQPPEAPRGNDPGPVVKKSGWGGIHLGISSVICWKQDMFGLDEMMDEENSPKQNA